MKRFKNILFVAEGGEPDVEAFERAVELARRNESRLTAMVAIDELPAYTTRLTPLMLRGARLKELEEQLKKLSAMAGEGVSVDTKIVEGKPSIEVIREVLSQGRDLVIKRPADASGLKGLISGSTDMRLLRKCPCPVWLIRPRITETPRPVMACVDFNEFDTREDQVAEGLNRKILQLAASVASLEKRPLHVVHAWKPVGLDLIASARLQSTDEEIDSYVQESKQLHEEWLNRLLDQAKQWIDQGGPDNLEMTTHLPQGEAGVAIPRLANDLGAGLVVMGTVARSGISGFLMGNTAENILTHLDCSVLAVKPDGFVSPVTLE